MIQIQDKFLNIPLIQGGMGVGVSLSSLAGNVAKCGGMGVISAAHPGYNFEGFRKDPTATSCRAIKYHIQRAKEIAEGKGLIGVNIMVAGNGYEELVKASVEGGCDAIISGAGLPLDLPKYAKGKALLAPIVSSGKAARLIAKVWEKRYQYTPDFVVIEGSKAGGHLGFKKEDLLAGTCQKLEDILEDVKKELAPFQEKFKKSIPIFVAGGIDCGKKIAEFIQDKDGALYAYAKLVDTEIPATGETVKGDPQPEDLKTYSESDEHDPLTQPAIDQIGRAHV